MPFLDHVKPFPEVTESGIDTLQFLEAATNFVGRDATATSPQVIGIFDVLGGFGMVKSDMGGNIEKVRVRYEANKATSVTLEELVKNEGSTKAGSATDALMWLLRALSFTGTGLQLTLEDKSQEELSVPFTTAYGGTLKKFHTGVLGFGISKVFGVAMKACPYRSNFYNKLAAEDPAHLPADLKTQDERTKVLGDVAPKVEPLLQQWLAPLPKIVQHMDAFYKKGKYGEIIKN
ncbi:glycolipid transfer protein [Roridomyces roridus]|uniref:Glycolipid transfer protein n=1 Tax=Roridomyces roridus TaxID=1738132 RepID=A0AAD7CE19_9AGAR|nr:glycolipid transfer protein [Roridomyces roridus]